MKTLTCGFIGLGLIGGSIARALKKYDYNIKVIAYDVNRDALSAAVSAGIADSTTRQIDDTFSNCDYLFLCAPVQKNDSNLAAVKKIISSSCILTDVGSVKTTIHEAVRAAGLENQFIGGHPMAGSEKNGIDGARPDLFKGAHWILCPVCRGKTRTQIREDTVLENFPLFCPKCRRTFLISMRGQKTEYLCQPNAKTQS